MKSRILFTVLLVCCGIIASSQEICDNGIDDDGDGNADLLDADCSCSVYPIIKNPSFEKISNCPTTYSQLQFAFNWQQPNSGSAGSTDLYHTCGQCYYPYSTYIPNIPMPVPDGVGFAGFFDIKQWLTFGAYKEFVTTCLDETLQKDSFYVLEFYLGFMTPVVQQPPSNSYYSFSPVNISLFGNPSCDAVPYGHLNDTAYKSCPMGTSPEWVELAKVAVTGSPGQWVKVRTEFKTPKNIRSLVMGPSCERSPYGLNDDWGFYLLDQVLLYNKDFDDIPSITGSGDICTDTLTLAATISQPAPSAIYQWYKNSLALAGETTPVLKLTRGRYGQGDYTVRVSINQKTFLSPDAIVAINDAGFTLEDSIAFCNSSSVQLQPKIFPGNKNCLINYLWQNGSSDTTLTVTKAGLYWFETEKMGCKRRDSVSVIAYPAPVVNLGADTTLCPGTRLLLSAGNPGLQYRWQDNSRDQTFLVTSPGTYRVKVSNGYCSVYDTIVVRYDKLPEIVFSNDTILCEGEQKRLRPAVNGNQFLWSTGSTLPEITVTQPGTYVLQLQNICGAVSRSVNIISGSCKFFMPSAFTPNKDGLNDFFGLSSYGHVSKFEFRIYNRWGHLVYESFDPAKRWNGTQKGKDLPTGVYVWMIKYTDRSNHEFSEEGTVTLIR